MSKRCNIGETLFIRYHCQLNDCREKWINDATAQVIHEKRMAWAKHLVICEQCQKAESEAK